MFKKILIITKLIYLQESGKKVDGEKDGRETRVSSLEIVYGQRENNVAGQNQQE